MPMRLKSSNFLKEFENFSLPEKFSNLRLDVTVRYDEKTVMTLQAFTKSHAL